MPIAELVKILLELPSSARCIIIRGAGCGIEQTIGATIHQTDPIPLNWKLSAGQKHRYVTPGEIRITRTI